MEKLLTGCRSIECTQKWQNSCKHTQGPGEDIRAKIEWSRRRTFCPQSMHLLLPAT